MTIPVEHRFPGAQVIESPWFGYPTIGHGRNVRPTILAVLHVTDGLSSAADTTRWGISQKDRSWTFCLDRDGGAVQALDPMTMTPWTNGDTKTPDLTNLRIAKAYRSGLNFNEWCFLTIECVGKPDTAAITTAQIATIRRILAWGAELSGLPLTRETVIGHYQVNSETRTRCPVLPVQRTAFFTEVLRRDAAQEIDMHLRPVADLWRFHANAPYWVDGPDPTYAPATATTPAVKATREPTGRFAGTPAGYAEVSMAEEWLQKGTDWTSGLWRLVMFPPGTPGKTSAVWVHRYDMDPLRPGGALAYAKFVQDAYFGTDYDPAADVIRSSTIGGPTADQVAALVKQGRQAGARDTAKAATDYAAKQ